MLFESCQRAEIEMNLRVAEEQSRAEAYRLARRARSGRPGGLSWQCRWLLCGLGYRLVGLGAWLEGLSLPRTRPAYDEA